MLGIDSVKPCSGKSLLSQEQAKLQCSRQPRPLPVMCINPDVTSIFGFSYEDFALEGYDAYPHIPAAVSV